MENQETVEAEATEESGIDMDSFNPADASEEQLDDLYESMRAELEGLESEESEMQTGAETETQEEAVSEAEGDQSEETVETSQTEETEGEGAEYIAKLEKQLKDKQQFIQRQAAEIGELRKQKRARREELQSTLDEAFAESAAKGLKVSKEIEALQAEEENLDEQQRAVLRRHNNEQIFTRHFGGKQVVHLDELVETLQEDKVPADAIENFKADPYGSTDALSLIQMTKRAILSRYLKQALSQLKEKDEQIKQLQNQPTEVLNGVKRALNQKPSITSKGGSAAAKSGSIQGMSESALSKMSEAELDEIAAEIGIKF